MKIADFEEQNETMPMTNIHFASVRSNVGTLQLLFLYFSKNKRYNYLISIISLNTVCTGACNTFSS